MSGWCYLDHYLSTTKGEVLQDSWRVNSYLVTHEKKYYCWGDFFMYLGTFLCVFRSIGVLKVVLLSLSTWKLWEWTIIWTKMTNTHNQIGTKSCPHGMKFRSKHDFFDTFLCILGQLESWTLYYWLHDTKNMRMKHYFNQNTWYTKSKPYKFQKLPSWNEILKQRWFFLFFGTFFFCIFRPSGVLKVVLSTSMTWNIWEWNIIWTKIPYT